MRNGVASPQPARPSWRRLAGAAAVLAPAAVWTGTVLTDIASLRPRCYTGDVVFAYWASLLLMSEIAAAGLIWPAMTAPIAKPMMFSKSDPEPEYQAVSS